MSKREERVLAIMRGEVRTKDDEQFPQYLFPAINALIRRGILKQGEDFLEFATEGDES